MNTDVIEASSLPAAVKAMRAKYPNRIVHVTLL
jgi:hypothetical protein